MHSAPSLPELQRAFCAAVLGLDSALADWVAGNGLDPQARLRIYRNLVANNHAAALRTAYPAIAKLVGDDCFEGLAARYQRDYGSGSGNLQDYGAGFAEFLTHLPETASLAYLPDVARLEWARQESYLAADAAPINAAALADISEHSCAEIVLALHPSLRLVSSNHPIWDVWTFCQQPAPEHLDLSGKAQAVLIWRSAHQLAMQPLQEAQWKFTAALLAGKTLAAARIDATVAEAGFDTAACLRWLAQNGLITGHTNHALPRRPT